MVVKKKLYHPGGSDRTLAWAKVEMAVPSEAEAKMAALSKSNSAMTLSEIRNSSIGLPT